MKEPSNTWEDPIQLVITLFTTITIEVAFYLKYIIFPDYMLICLPIKLMRLIAS